MVIDRDILTQIKGFRNKSLTGGEIKYIILNISEGEKMKIKEFLGMLVLDSNANEVGKIVDAEFDKETGKLTKIGISLRKNILSSSVIEVDFDDIKSIGDYVLLNIDIDKEAIIKEKEAKEEVAEEEAEE